SWEYAFELAARAGIGRDSTVVDVGCGRAAHGIELANRFGCRAIGVDLVFAPLTAATHPNVQLIQARVEQLPLGDGAADFVWCRDMLVHVPDIEKALRECARTLRRRGKMLLYTTLE